MSKEDLKLQLSTGYAGIKPPASTGLQAAL